MVPAIHRGRYPLLEMVVGGVCAHGATNLFRRGQYPLLEGLLAGVSAHGELQELAVGRGCLRDPLPRRDLASGIPGVRRDLASGIPVRPGGGSRKQTVVLRTTFFVAHPVPYANKFATVLSGHKKKMMPTGIIRFAFERKTGFEPAALSLGS